MHIFHKWKPYRVTRLEESPNDKPDIKYIYCTLWLKCTVCKIVKKDPEKYDYEWNLEDFK